MNFAKSKSKIITKTFDYKFVDENGTEQSEPITISFYEKCLTPAFLDSLTQYEAKKDSMAIAKHISRNIVSWNLSWDGKPFPPSVENLTEVCDFEFLMQVVSTISESFAGNESKPTTSQSLSVVSEKSETVVANS